MPGEAGVEADASRKDAKMKLKIVEVAGKKYAEITEDGTKPIYVHEDGKEVPFDAPATVAKIGQLNGEAKSHRERAEGLDLKLKPFEKITDPVAALAALDTVKNIKDGELIAAGKVEEIKTQARKAAEETVANAAKAAAEALAISKADNDKLRGQLNSTLIGGSFSRAKMITDEKHTTRLAIPADVAEAVFGKHFKVDENTGEVVGYKTPGGTEQVFSLTNPGSVAKFDEALEIIVGSYPNKDQIVLGKNAKGDGAPHNQRHQANGGGKTITRAEFNALDPASQRKVAIPGTADSRQIQD
jgi:hypothetical protein